MGDLKQIFEEFASLANTGLDLSGMSEMKGYLYLRRTFIVPILFVGALFFAPPTVPLWLRLILAAISVFVWWRIGRNLAAGPPYGTTPDLSGKVVVITGANSGLGLETTLRLVALKATVVLGVRDLAKGREAVAEVLKKGAGNARGWHERLVVLPVDLASYESVRKFAGLFREQFHRLDILVCNGGFAYAKEFALVEGVVQQFTVNYLSHFLLVKLLWDVLEASEARVVSVSSIAHAFCPEGIDYEGLRAPKDYRYFRMYGQSKLAQILFTNELARRSQRMTAVSLHPGDVLSPIWNKDAKAARVLTTLLRPVMLMVLKTVEEGAHTVVFGCVDPGVVSGQYYYDCTVGVRTEVSKSQEAGERLWEWSDREVTASGHQQD